MSFAVGGAAAVAQEASDISLLSGDLRELLFTLGTFSISSSHSPPCINTAILDLARATGRVIRQNLFFSFVYNVLAIPAAAAGLLNPMIAAAAMTCSSLSVLFNSLRLARLAVRTPNNFEKD